MFQSPGVRQQRHLPVTMGSSEREGAVTSEAVGERDSIAGCRGEIGVSAPGQQ